MTLRHATKPEDCKPVTSRPRPRNPENTRNAILNAAIAVVAEHGPDAINVSKVAQLAGVNRGTAYKYFPTPEALVAAAIDWMSEQLFTGIFGDSDVAASRDVAAISIEDLTGKLISFAMENPNLGRAWLLENLGSRERGTDPFWNRFRENFAVFTKTEGCRVGVDSEVLSVLFLGAFFLWPVFARKQVANGVSRAELSKRLSREVFRLVTYGVVRPGAGHQGAVVSAPQVSELTI